MTAKTGELRWKQWSNIYLFFGVLGSTACKEESAPSAQTVSSSPQQLQATPQQQVLLQPKEQIQSKKKALLETLIGDFYLSSISGTVGASTMLDHVQIDGRWSAAGSSISHGMREEYDIEISAKKLYASLKLRFLKSCLSRFFMVGKPIFNTIYKRGNGL